MVLILCFTNQLFNWCLLFGYGSTLHSLIDARENLDKNQFKPFCGAQFDGFQSVQVGWDLYLISMD